MPDQVEFCGERYRLDPGRGLTIGREGELKIDDNPYLHRDFLRVQFVDGLWWLVNVGSQLTATVSDEGGGVHALLAPGAHLPLVFGRTSIRFSAASTTYEFSVELDSPIFIPQPQPFPRQSETTTFGPTLTHDQRLLLLALTERTLRSVDRSISELPTSAEAAERLGWSLTRFNRKLDYLCQKLSKSGVRGLHGGPESLASNRRFRLVEYALAARLVSPDELPLLDTRVPAKRS